jgi:hypothetical protein
MTDATKPNNDDNRPTDYEASDNSGGDVGDA